MNYKTGLGAGLGLYALVVLQNAWLCDDAFITYRTADNFLNGYGLTWNTTERVQAFTNPLWLFAVSCFYFISGEIYYTAILLSAAISVLAVWLVLPAADGRAALLGGLLCACSKAFVDYSTSGLENPLTHLLLALFIRNYLARPQALFSLALLAGLAALNRMDTVLFYLPTLVWVWWPQRSLRTAGTLALGFVPFALWEIFALCYYGFPFPNTAYAKLAAGINSGELAVQGLYYAANSLRFDPLTLGAITGALGLVLWRRETILCPLALGLVLYMLYTLRIGGGFMSGRFYAAPFLIAVALLLRALPWPEGRRWLAAPGLVIALALAAPYPTFLSGPNYGANRVDDIDANHSIGDERAFYYPYTGLLNAVATRQDTLYPIHGWADWGRRLRGFADGGKPAVVTWPFVGFIGFYAGPQCHLIDIFGLSDPLTARLPARRDQPWRIGHFKRILPAGYLETHLYGPNLIADPDLKRFYDQLKIVVSGDLLTAARWIAIWGMNTGQYDLLIDGEKYRHPTAADIGRSERITMGGAGSPPITFKPDRFMHYSGLGDVYFERRQYIQAAQTYRQALALDIRQLQRLYPEDYREKMAALYLRLAQALTALDQWPAARAVLATFTRIDPQNETIRRALQNLQAP